MVFAWRVRGNIFQNALKSFPTQLFPLRNQVKHKTPGRYSEPEMLRIKGSMISYATFSSFRRVICVCLLGLSISFIEVNY